MPEDKHCSTLLQPNRSSDKKKERKKRRKKATPSENTEKPLPPETLPLCQQAKLRTAGKKDRELLSSQRSKRHLQGSPSPRVDEHGARSRESLRWEGALEDPQAEERRLELYRANRRQRYIRIAAETGSETQEQN